MIQPKRPRSPRRTVRREPPKLARNSLLLNPAGTYSFVGNVDTALAFVTLDGDVPTPEQIEDARRFGPRLARVKTRTFPTKEAALEAARELGVPVTMPREA